MRKALVALVTLIFLLSGGPVLAQAIVGKTVQTTDTSTTSIKVGCAVGSSTCTGGISAGPIASGPISIGSGYVEIQSFVPGSQTNRLVNNSGTLQWNGTPLAAGSSLSGTTNTIPLFTAPNAVGNSIMTQSGTTITVANTLSATTLTGTLSTASQPNITTLAGLTTANALTSASSLATVGTITTGVWNGTIIDIAHGGTGVTLSGTGGASQFLRQNSLGGNVTVVRPAVADLSDASHVIVDTGSYSNPSWITNLAWSAVNKTGSSLADLTTRSAADLSSGTLLDARLSTNVPLLNGTATYNTFSGIRVGTIADSTGVSTLTFTPALVTLTENSNEILGIDTNALRLGAGVGSISLGSTVNPASITGNTNDYSIGAGYLARLSATGAFNLTGVIAPGVGTGGRTFWMSNLGSNTITLKNNDAGSTAVNRFLCPGNVDYSLTQFKSVLLYYSYTDSRWIILGGA